MKKLIASVLFALTVAGATAPAMAQSTRYYNDRSDLRIRRSDVDTGSERRQVLADRADEIAQRARRLFERGRLNRIHLDRTLDKLTRVRSTVRTSGRVDRDRFEADMDWMRQVENTLEEWSRADRDRDRDGLSSQRRR